MAGDLSILHCAHHLQCTSTVAKRFDGYFTLQLLTRGAVLVSYAGKRYEFNQPWFWPAYPGPWITMDADPRVGWWEHRYVAFKGPLVARWTAAGLMLDQPQAMPPAVAGLVERFDELIASAKRLDPWASLRAINLLESILIDLAAARAQPAEHEPWLEDALQTLSTLQVDEPIDYAALADRAGLALSTFRRRFRAAVGIPLHQYVLQVRLNEAQQLLRDTDWPIKQIAGKLGYRDVFFFTRQFRTHVGVAPATYRKSRQT